MEGNSRRGSCRPSKNSFPNSSDSDFFVHYAAYFRNGCANLRIQ
jgi:hypothetical protein